MKHNLTSAIAKAMLFALLALFNIQTASAQDGTQNDGFQIQITFPNGQKSIYGEGHGGFGWAAFGTDISSEFEVGIAWGRTADSDSLCCNPAVNSQEIAGKAALIRRGTCPFQVKANNVEAAGASVALIVNHSLVVGQDDHFVQNMAANAGTPPTNIPAIFLCRAVGDQIIAAIDAGQSVKIKFIFPRLYNTASAFHFATPTSQVRPLENIGVTFQNRTSSTEADVVVKADIIASDGSVVSMYEPVPPTAPGETVYVEFPPYTPPPVKGRFDIVFSTNKYHATYDTARSSFILTDYTFGTDNFELLPNGVGPNIDQFLNAGFVYHTGSLCATGSQGAVATHVTFGVTNVSEVYVPGDPAANSIYAFIFDADFDNDGLIDPFFDLFDLNLLSYGIYEMQGTELPDELIDMPLSDINTGDPYVNLLPNHFYYVTLYYDGSLNGSGASVRFAASKRVEYLNYLSTPLFLGQLYSGWSNATIVNRLQLEGYSSDNQTAVPPVADFNANTNGLTTSFANNSIGAVAYLWDFGDGNNSTEANPVHDYATDGVYTVKLIATNAEGSNAAVRTVQAGVAPPIAVDFNANASSGCTPLTVEFADASVGTGLTYLWSFPGGNPATSTLPNPTVTYESGGTFNASLLISDGFSSDFILKSALITVASAPEAAFTANAAPNGLVSFNNTSSNADSYLWSFGDGTISTEASPTHTYTNEGDFDVTLFVSNTCGTDTFTQSVTVYLPPTAGFSADITLGCAPMTVQFTNQSSANVTDFNWSFPGGNPATSTDPNPSVAYQTPGIYSVLLNVNSPGGSAIAALVDGIIVNRPPSAGFTFNADTTTVVFTNTSQDAATYNWNFGDGATSTEANPTHTYAAPGNYTVTLTAENDCGQTTAVQTVMATSGTNVPLLAESKVRILPNPASEEIRVELDFAAENANVTVTLLDGSGRQIVMEHLNRVRQMVVTLPVKQLPSGAYQIWVQSEEGVALRKVQVQH